MIRRDECTNPVAPRPNAADPGTQADREGRGIFATTCWTTVLEAGRDSESGRQALESLCRAYWFPVYALIRRRGFDPETARDFTQAFFVQFLARDGFSRVCRKRGCFRSYLSRAVHHFLADEWDRARTQKRGGGVVVVHFESGGVEERYLEAPPELTPDRVFDRQWALALMAEAKRRLESELVEAGRDGVRRVLNDLGSTHPRPLEDHARDLGTPLNTLKSMVRRARLRQAQIIRELIAETVESPIEVEAELRQLLAAMER